MYTYIGTRGPAIAAEYRTKKAREAAQRKKEKVDGDFNITLTQHGGYFALQDIRPAAISAKLQSSAADSYDFAAHANPATTHKHYDRRRVKRASATE
ncbi:hypothetical protein [Pandoraea pnomenusa]|uniref:hypothetical protein n=1 Tax=Pandoraea pnomenusa TaxID=93220 RepID=UPI0033400F8A